MMVIKGHLGSTPSSGSPRQIKPQPIKSWTAKSEKVYEKSRVETNGFVPSSQRVLYTKTKNPLPVKYNVRGEWELQECEENLVWLNSLLKKKKHRPLTDLRKGVSDGLTLVNLLEILFNEKIQGIQTRPIIRAQRNENIHLCLRFLQTKGFDTRGVSAEEITDGNLRATLALINTLRRRFENSAASQNSQKQDSAPSTPRGGPVGDTISQNEERVSLQGREPSIKSHISGQSETSIGRRSGEYSMNGIDASLEGKGGMPAPKPMLNGHAEPSLPGLMGSTGQDDSMPVTNENDHTVMSMTELGSKGTSQHGIETRRTQMSKERPSGAIRPQPIKATGNTWAASTAFSNAKSPLRDALSMSVEEKLKSLLDSPTPRGLVNGHQETQFDDGELLELPPPNFRDLTDEDDAADEEANLQAMLEDPDKFDYPKDWDRYISGYVPSTNTEKKEGPRAQALLDKPPSSSPPPSTSTPSSILHQPGPFFHGPSSQHMGAATSQVTQDMPAYTNSPDRRPQPIRPISKKLPENLRNMSGVVYGEEPVHSNLSQTWSPPYRPQVDSRRGGERQLPTYEDHIQRHTPPVYRKKHQLQGHQGLQGHHQTLQGQGQSPPTSGYESRGHSSSSPKTMPRTQGFQKYMPPSRAHYGNAPDAGFHEHYNQQGDPRSQQIFMSQSLPQPLDDPMALQRLYGRPIGHGQGTAFVPIRASNPLYPMGQSGMGSEEPMQGIYNEGYSYDEQYSESSSRSHTPPLPPLSPDITPPETPPDSPSMFKKNRSSSIWVTNNHLSPLNMRRQRTSDTLPNSNSKSWKGAVNRSQSASNRLGDSRSPLRRSGGKGRRKSKHGSRSSSRSGSTAGKQVDSRRSSANRGNTSNTSLPLNQVLEQTEASDSDHVDAMVTRPEAAMMPADDEREDTPRDNPSRTPSSGKESQNVDAIRSQLLALEGMYKEILQVIGSNKVDKESPRPPVGKVSIPSSPIKTLAKARSAKIANKQRERDIKTVNKRFSRVESHVVTLARSVAHLSSELRSQNALIREIESLRIEVNQLKDIAYYNHDVGAHTPTRVGVPQCANPHRIRKLTKFFGEEPPLLSIFLKDLGYERYAENFKKAGINMMELPYLSEEKLENIGIPIGPRLRILEESHMMV